MPSIPQSLLWISLVVLWLFVLVPMLISKRDAVRRTSDVALATRVLNSGQNPRLRRRGPAAGHNSDPDWQPADEDEDLDELDEPEEEPAERSVVVAEAVVEEPEPEYLDVDVIDEDAAALPVGQTEELPLDFDEEPVESVETEEPEEPVEVEEPVEPEAEADGSEDEYEYVDDSSGLEAPSETDLQIAESVSAARRRRRETTTAAVVSARKYAFRKRMLAGMAAVLMASAVAGYFQVPWSWWVCASTGAVTVLYLAYLRRQTRIEERLRRRRAQRMARARLGVENTDDREYDVVPSRLRRPGSAVLEIDDEDPIFEHLDYAPSARHYDLPRAAGQ
ncbi:divisome protein SepX/GlpR [Mycobacterium hubeiense]|uniref:divisome protein SepX/GlpR n=1 Tax=Mycobacterium hubeiense TaxID=1867256 RepID=UPI000C7F64BE|nr:gephyrin-like molybdotransferase receptor GlpR [Mycobacterium sp. QGD 101]